MPSTITDRLTGINTSVAIKAPCVVSTTANITLSAEQTINGVAVVAGDRVLVKDQTDAKQNGIYVAAVGAWSRATDFDGEFDVVNGTRVSSTGGTLNAYSFWICTSANPIDFETDNITFALDPILSNIQTIYNYLVALVGGITDLWGGTSTGTANALVFTPTTPISANAAGIFIRGIANLDNLAASTVATSGKAAIQIVKFNGASYVDIEKGDIRINMPVLLQYISATQVLLLNPRGPNRVVNTVSNASAVTINSDTTTTWTATAQAANLTFNAPSGTPVDGQDLLIRITDDNNIRTLTFTTGAAGFEFSSNLPAPSATTANKMIELGFKYNLGRNRWQNLAQLNGF